MWNFKKKLYNVNNVCIIRKDVSRSLETMYITHKKSYEQKACQGKSKTKVTNILRHALWRLEAMDSSRELIRTLMNSKK